MREDGQVAFQRVPITGPGISGQVTALMLGGAAPSPLTDTNDALNWGNRE